MSTPNESIAETLAALAPLEDAGQVRVFDLRTFAEALGLDQRTVKAWADKSLKTVQHSPNGKRYVQLEEIKAFARKGWHIDIERLLDAGP